MTADLPDRFLASVRREMDSGSIDASLTDVARSGAVQISLEHLRGHDPETTRIVHGCTLGPIRLTSSLTCP